MTRPIRRAVIVTLVLFLVSEFTAQAALAGLSTPGHDAPLLGTLGRPMAQDSDASDPQNIFHDTQWQSNGDALIPDDYTSPSLNYRGGFRVTTGQPATYTRTVWLIGASNVVGTELADNETIASQLQMLLPNFRVVNVGMSGAKMAQMEARLKQLPLSSGDTVIILSGAVEGISTWRTAHSASGTRITDGICAVALHLAPLALVKLACWREQYTTPAAYDDRLFAAALTAYEPYADTLKRIRLDMAERNVQFANVLTPFCLCAWLNDYDGMTRSFVAFASLARQDKQIIDLSRIVSDEDFYSQFHVNMHGSRIVAQALFEVVH
jgi:hypothetical protein